MPENNLKNSIKELEKAVYTKYLIENKFDIAKTAKALKVTRATVYVKIKKFEINVDKLKVEELTKLLN